MALTVFLPNQHLTGLDSARKPARAAKGATFFNRPPVPPKRYVFQPPFTPTRSIVTGVGPVAVTQPRVHDRRPGETLRGAAISGLNIRSGDSDFTSDSYDPIVGAVFTWQRDRGWFDADLIYQFNTGGGESRHDALRYDLAYSYRLTPARFEPGNAWELDALAELNGRYITDGSHEVFLSPDSQLATAKFRIEGMTCDGCATGLRAVLDKLPDVASAEVDYPTKTAVIRYSADSRRVADQVVEAVKAAGYSATLADNR